MKKVRFLERPVLLVMSLLTGNMAFGKTLTWNECVQRTWANNADLRASGHDETSSKQGVEAARAGYFPKVSASMQVNKSNDYTRPDSGIASGEVLSGKVTAEVFSGFKTNAEVKIAKATEETTIAASGVLRNKILYELRSAFLEALYAQKNVELSKKIADRLDANTKFLERMYRGGREVNWAYLKAQGDESEAKWEVKHAEAAVLTAIKKLEAFFGGKERLDGYTVEGEFDSPSPPDISGVVAASEKQADVEAERSRVAAAEASIEKAKAGHWPTVSLFANYDKTTSDNTRLRDGWSVGAQMDVPIFSGFATRASIKEAAEKHLSEALTLDSLILQKRSAVIEAYEQYRTSREKLDFLREQQSAAERRAEIIDQEYSAGLVQFIDWEQAQSLLTTAQRKFLQGKFQAALDYAAFEKAQGKELPRP